MKAFESILSFYERHVLAVEQQILNFSLRSHPHIDYQLLRHVFIQLAD